MSKDWEIRKIKDVCEVIAGQSPEGKYYNTEGKGLAFYQGKKEFGDKYIGEPTTWSTKTTKIAECNDILMSVRAPVGPINFATQKICIGRGLAAIRASEFIEKEFLFNFLLKNERELKGNNGAVFNSINKTQIENIDIPIPPLPEQKRIVSILDKAFAAIDKAKANAEQNLNNAKELFESYLQGVFNNGHDWKTKELTEIVQERCSLSYGIVQPGDDFTNGLPVIRPVDMKQKYINKTTLKLIDPERAKSYQRTKLVGDELLLCVRGETGMVSLITEELNGANVTRGIVPIAFDTAQLSLSFGYYLFLSPFVKRQIKEKTYGAALMQINIKDLRKLTMPLPDLDSQNEIVKTCDKLLEDTQKLEKIFCKKLDDLEELKKSILHKAFNGEF